MQKLREKTAKRCLLLLVEPQCSKSVALRDWLKHKGFLTWWANDVSHAIEELSDFTVKNRPDIVMLEASPLTESLHALREGLCGPEGQDYVSVVAMSDRGPQSLSERFFATDFAQLEAMIHREAGPRSRHMAVRMA